MKFHNIVKNPASQPTGASTSSRHPDKIEWMERTSANPIPSDKNEQSVFGQLVVNNFNVKIVNRVPIQSQQRLLSAPMPPPPITYQTTGTVVVPVFLRRKIHMQQEPLPQDVEFTPSCWIEDTEAATAALKVSLGEIILAAAIATGHGNDYFFDTSNVLLWSEWNDGTTPYPFMQEYGKHFTNLVAAAEKILHENDLLGKNPWQINLDSILQKDYFTPPPFRQSREPIYPEYLFENLPGEQGGCLEQFATIWSGSTSTVLPVRAVYPTMPINYLFLRKAMPLPWRKYPLFGLNRLHQSEGSMVYLTPSITEAQFNMLNQVPVISWVGGAETADCIDFEPLQGYQVVYLLNPNTFFTPQQAYDCFEKVCKRLKEKEITPKVTIVEYSDSSNAHSPVQNRLDSLLNQNQ